jgi:hypothetical protein
MGASLSRGPGLLRGWLLTYLSTQVPALIVRARSDWSVDAFALPDVQTFNTYDLPEAGQFPAIGAYFQNEVHFERRDYSDRMEEEYWVRHQGNVAVWVQTPYTDADGHLPQAARQECLRLRDDLTELTKQALLLTPSINQPDDCWLEETAIAVNKLEPFQAKSNSPVWLAGAIIPVVYNMRSELVRAAAGSANTIHTTVAELTT